MNGGAEPKDEKGGLTMQKERELQEEEPALMDARREAKGRSKALGEECYWHFRRTQQRLETPQATDPRQPTAANSTR